MTPLLLALLQDVDPPPEPPPPDPIMVAPPEPSQTPPPAPEPVSEGRMLVTAYNAGFQWGLSPGVVWVNGDAGFALSVHVGYGFDLGSIILVPGLAGSFYFTDPSVYVGMPTMKILFPIDRFAPFVEGGVGAGYVSDPVKKTGVALNGGGGFEVYFSHFAIGAEVSYQTITGTPFHGIGVGPILAIGF